MDHGVRHAAGAAPPSANISLLVRNLRLLDLDLRSNWPGITVQTFSTKDANQNLRQRVKCVEWALYQLFALWDVEETNNKLRPFFPPLEPLQSLNLRAALFRCLSDLKKSGVLGKEVALRKTMLDECKGDKFEEMLASFSTLVLRKVAAGRSQTNPAMRLALKASISKDEQQLLMPLILAHRVSIGKSVQDKSERKESYDQLWELLELKELELDRRSEELRSRESTSSRSAVKASGRLEEAVKKQWTGDMRWADVIVNGVQERPGDALLQLPFDEFLNRTLGGVGTGEETPSSSNVLNELNARVAEQRNRLETWKEYYRTLQTSAEPTKATGVINSATPSALMFRNHQHLTLEMDKPESQASRSLESVPENAEYDGIVASMHQELAKFKDTGFPLQKPLSKIPGKSRSNRKTTTSASSNGDAAEAAFTKPPVALHHSDASRRHPRTTLSENDEIQNPQPTARRTSTLSGSQEAVKPFTRRLDNMPLPSDRGKISKDNSSVGPLVSTSEARQEPHSSISPIRTTLLERTRQSMSLLPNPNTRPHPPSKPPRPSSTAFPINPFETPPKKKTIDGEKTRRHSTSIESPASENGGDSTDREELFSQEADYASIFKSRPRVKVSPEQSPSLRWRG